jgi:hypothetical protein
LAIRLGADCSLALKAVVLGSDQELSQTDEHRDAGNLITVMQIGRARVNGPVTAKLCVSGTTTGAAMDGGEQL